MCECECTCVRVRCVLSLPSRGKVAQVFKWSNVQVFKCSSSWKLGVNSGFWVIRGSSSRRNLGMDSQPTDGGRQATGDRERQTTVRRLCNPLSFLPSFTTTRPFCRPTGRSPNPNRFSPHIDDSDEDGRADEQQSCRAQFTTQSRGWPAFILKSAMPALPCRTWVSS